MIQPKEILVKGLDGEEKKFTIHKLPATVGRKIVANYPVSALPKIGDYKVNEEIMIEMMSYVTIDLNGKPQQLNSRAFIDNHVDDWQMLAKLELEMLEYNTNFFGSGKLSKSLDSFAKKITSPSAMKTLTDLLGQLSQVIKQHSKN